MLRRLHIYFAIAFIAYILYVFQGNAFAQTDKPLIPQEERFEAEIIKVDREITIDANSKEQVNFLYRIRRLNGGYRDKDIEIDSRNITQVEKTNYKTGD